MKKSAAFEHRRGDKFRADSIALKRRVAELERELRDTRTAAFVQGSSAGIGGCMSDPTEAAAAAINHVGKGEAVCRESLSDAQFKESLATGKLIGHSAS